MLLYKMTDNSLHIKKESFEKSIQLSQGFVSAPVMSKDKNYMAIGGNKKLCVYDMHNDNIIECEHKFKSNIINQMRFDAKDQLYIIDNNAIKTWNIAKNEVEILYEIKRTVHGPEHIGVSPDGRYVSFCKYKNSSDYLFLVDTRTGECRDLKCSVYHYAWLDNTHIVWTKSGGLKVFDTDTGKSKTIVKDHTTLFKKSCKADASLLEHFMKKTEDYFFIDLDLQGIHDNRIWFTFAIRHYIHRNEDEKRVLKQVCHLGVWSVNKDGSSPEYCYAIPPEYYKAVYKRFFAPGSIAWKTLDGLKLWNGETENVFSSDWDKVLTFEDSSK